MNGIRSQLRRLLHASLQSVAKAEGLEFPTCAKDLLLETPPSPELGDLAAPMLQYTGARFSSMLRKHDALERTGRFDPSLISSGDEWELVESVADFPSVVVRSADELNPSIVAAYLYELAKRFRRYYHDQPILHNEDQDLVAARVTMARTVGRVLQKGLELIGIEFLEAM